LKAFDIFEVPSLKFIEPSYQHLPEGSFTDLLLSSPAEEARLAVDEDEWPVALAVRDAKEWKGTSFLLRPPSLAVVEFFESVDGDVVTTTQEEWAKACREYYSKDIIDMVPAAVEDFSPDRAARVKDLLEELWRDRRGEVCLDCGCGSGMGSAMLREAGLVPVSYDNDPSLLARGLKDGRLEPEGTMCIDGALASHYMRPAPLGLALMAGTINDHTAMIWKAVLGELLDMTEETLVTVETEKESELVRMWALGMGKKVRKFENDRDPFYDRWGCVITE